MKMKRVISIICMVCMLSECISASVVNAASAKIGVSQDVESKKLEVEKETELNSEKAENENQSEISAIDSENNSQAAIKNQNKGKIEGFKKIRIYTGEKFDYKENITATDSNGNNITDLISVEGKVDTSTPGEYRLMYSVTDELGEKYTLERYVTVVEKNEFNIFTQSSDKKDKKSLFSISLDNKTSRYTVYNQSTEPLNLEKADEVVFKMRVLGSDNKEKLSLELLGKDTGDSEKFNALKGLEYSYGDFLEINPMEFMSEGFNIEGPVLGDVKLEDEDYSDGIDNADYISNVRFKIQEDGIYSIYNKAPEIKGLEPMETLLTDRNSQLKGVSVTDDHDKNISNNDIEIYEEKDSEGNTIGLRYEVTDSWGRTLSAVRYLKSEIESLEESEDINIVSYNMEAYSDNHSRSGNVSRNIITVKGFTYNNGSDIRFRIKFNGDNNKIEIYDRDSRLFDNKMTGKYFEISLYNKNGVLKKRLTLNGSDRADDKKIDDFNNTIFEFGDQINIYHAYSEEKLLIAGNIQDANFNTSTGIDKEKLESTRFELTKNGFKYLVNTPPRITWPKGELIITRGQNVDLLADITVEDDIDKNIKKSTVNITQYNPNKLGRQEVTYSVKDSWGAVGTAVRTVNVVSDGALANTDINIKNAAGTERIFSIGFDDVDKKILIKNKNETGTKLDESKPNSLAFLIKIISKAGVTKKEIKLNGNDDANSKQVTALNEYRYNEGDYIEIWSPNYERSITIDGTIIQDEIIKEDYSTGITEEDFIKNVRFKIEKTILNAKYNTAPQFVFEENPVLKRGQEFDPLDFIKKIVDDYDKLNKNLVRVSYDVYDFEKIGNHNITYRITDSWGRATEKTLTVTVVPKNELENNRIYLLPNNSDSSNDSALVTLSFDEVSESLHAEVKDNDFIAGPVNGTAFEISIFRASGELKARSTIKYNAQIDETSLADILSANIEHGDMINFKAYSNEGIRITGPLTGENSYDSGFKSEDIMIHTRFRVTENGLVEVYNKAPEFEGVEDKTIMKKEPFNKLEGVRVTDDHDDIIDNSNIVITGDIDVTRAGYQTLIYKVTDSWGRSKEVKRTIFVRPLAENNKIVLKNLQKNDAFILGFDFSKMNFTISETEYSNSQLNPTNTGREFSIVVRNPQGDIINEVELLGTDTGNSPKLQKLNEVKLVVGAQISLWAKNSKRLSVRGTIANQDEIQENYEDGIENREYMNNVRFVGTEDGIKVIHNKAPVVTVPENTDSNPFVLYKGDDYRQLLLEDVTVTDENTFDSTINENNVEIKFKSLTPSNSGGENDSTGESADDVAESTRTSIENEGDNPDGDGESNPGGEDNAEEEQPEDSDSDEGFIALEDLDVLGEYEVYYTATDSWERKSETKKRRITLKTSIDRNSISFPGHKPGIGDYEAFKLKFDSQTMKFKLENRSPNQIHVHGTTEFFRIRLFSDKGVQKQEVVLQARDTGQSEKLNKLLTTSFEYGDYLTIYAYQTKRVKIAGPVRNEYEDYSNGVELADDLKFTRFYITEKGLESKFMPDPMGTYESLIEFIGTNGGTPFKMKFNHDTRTITYPSTTEFYNYSEPEKRNVFRVYIKRNNQTSEVQYTSDGNQTGVNSGIKNLFGNSNQGTFNDGEYLRFEYLDIPSTFIGIRASGNLSEENANYKDKLVSYTDIKNVRFYLRSNGNQKYLDPVYNYAPTFKTIIDGEKVDGLQDLNIYEEDVANFDPKSDVVVTDDHDTTKPEKQFTATGPRLNGVGKYIYTYTATDSWGREARLTRNIYVRPNVYKNTIKLYPKLNNSSDGNIPEDNNSGDVAESLDSGNSEGDETPPPTESNNKPAFEILFDNETHRYVVKNRIDTAINPEVGEETAFRITIYDSLRNERETIELKGSDTGLSEELDKLNDVTFQYGDTIRVWAADSKSLKITGSITKDIQTDDETEREKFNAVDYAEGADKQDYLSNVAFKTSENDITAYYNKAPEIKIPNLIDGNNLNILFGENVDLLAGVTVEDDRDRLQVSSIDITGKDDVNSHEIGTYNVAYNITDTWGRSISKEVTVNIISKMVNNSIEVYGEASEPQRSEGQTEHKFTLKFNTSTNKIEIHRNNNVEEDSRDELTPAAEDSDEVTEEIKENYFQIVVKNRNGTEKANVILSRNEMDSNDYLEELTKINFFNDDIISVYSMNKNNVKIKGNLVNAEGKDFSEGFENVEQFSEVKFKITNSGFELIQYKPLVLRFSENLVINRGNESDLFRGVQLSYEDNTEVDLYNVSVVTEGINIYEVGKYNVKYTITDIWGKTIEKTRTVTVIERNPLEHNRIVLKDSNNNKELMEFYIDTINNKIITRKFDSEYTGDEEDTLIKLTVYDENSITRGSIEVTKDNLDSIEESEIEYNYGDLIGISVYDNKNGLSIEGNIQEGKENYLDGVDNEDYINNVRFKIADDDGLESVYNNAPVITIKDELTLYKDEIPDLYKGVTAKDPDEHDKSVSEADIIVDTELDITRIGEYTATYILQDTWGRETKETRNIIVKSSLLNNKIEFYKKADKENPLFDIGINLQEKKFEVTKNNKALRQVRKEAAKTSSSEDNSASSGNGEEVTPPNEGEDNTNPPEDNDDTNTPDGEGGSNNPELGVGVVTPDQPIEGVEYQFKLFDEDGNEKNSLSITEDDMVTRNGIESKLREFNNTPFDFGDYISIYAKLTENNVRITGNIDLPNNITEKYSDGIDEEDFMYNVRFKIYEDAMDAVYNEAPSIRLLNPNEVTEVFCGDDHDYGAETEIRDDHDLDIGSDNITISEEDKASMNEVGEHEITLILTDSWGRSVSVKRKYSVKSSIGRNVISFPGYDKRTQEDYEVFKLGFNTETKQLIVKDQLARPIHASEALFFRITVYNQDGIQKRQVSLNANELGTSNKLQNLHNLNFEYGDYINIYAYQTGRVKIFGPVREQLEDYSDGVQLADDLAKTYFHITEAGLRSEFRPDTLAQDESLIEFIATNGGTPFKLKLNHTTKRVTFPTTTEFYNYDAGKNKVFRVKYYSSRTKRVTNYDSLGTDDRVKEDLKSQLQNNGFNDGDYLAFEYLKIPDSFYGLRVTGKVVIPDNADEELKKEDYSDGIQNKRNLTEVRFYLNKDGEKGIFPVRVPAPTIEGAGDTDVVQSLQPFDLTSNVIATAPDGTVITPTMTITGEGDSRVRTAANGRAQLNVSQVGLYLVKYEVKYDDITTTIYRNIRVYTNASLHFKDIQHENGIPMEQGSYRTPEEQKQYLKTLVLAQDPEDQENEEKTQRLTEKIEVDVSEIQIETPGRYPIKYTVVNDYGKTTELTANVDVTRSINVTVPTTVPFQVVTNLIDEDADPFISGILKIQNNRTSDVRVSLESFTQEGEAGSLEIVSPDTFDNWDEISEADSMTKMALGIFVKSGFKEDNVNSETDSSTDGDDSDAGTLDTEVTEEKKNLTWLIPNNEYNKFMGVMPRAEGILTPSEVKFSFTSKHGKKFIGGTSKGKFNLVFKFE